MALNCVKGFACGAACIARYKDCERRLNGEISNTMDFLAREYMNRIREANPKIAGARVLSLLDQLDREGEEYVAAVVRSVAYINRTSTRMVGIGTATLSKDEVDALMANKEKLLELYEGKRVVSRGDIHDSTIDPEIVTPRLVDDIWESLPSEYRGRLESKGSISDGNWWGPDGYTERPTVERGKLILRNFIIQNAKDAYTGLPISLLDSDLEHIKPFSKYGREAETPDNMVLTSKSVNQTKSDLTMEEFFQRHVEPRSKWTKDQWDKLYEEQRAKAELAGDKRQLASGLANDRSKINPTTIKALGEKSYYLLREMGLPNYTWPSSGRGIQTDFAKIAAVAFARAGSKEEQIKIRDILSELSYRMSAKESTNRAIRPGLGETKEQAWTNYFKDAMSEVANVESIMKEFEIAGYGS